MSSESRREGSNLHLCVDLDGTLTSTDLLFETFFTYLKQSPLALLHVLIWLLQGRPTLKRRLAERVNIDAALLPYNEPVLEYIRAEHSRGRKVVLASASDELIVKKIADHLECFHESFGTAPGTNLKGERKAELLTERYGEMNFEYIGNEPVDRDVWKYAGAVSVATRDKGFAEKVKKEFPGANVIKLSGKGPVKGLIRAMRIHQWAKNLLVFLPLVMAHRILEPLTWYAAILSFFAFSFCASGVYLINDLLDLDSDRRHHRKKNRPFASGALPLKYGLLCVPLLFATAVFLSTLLPIEFLVVLAVYLLMTTLYSFRLKQVALVDIILLATLYTIRIIGGGVATDTVVSQWLLSMSMFLFFSLACVKRYSELHQLKSLNKKHTHGRGYAVEDIEQIAIFGSVSGYMATLVLAFYINSLNVTTLYSRPQMIWLVCPLLVYWISRTWLLARRGLVHDDPIVFALRDKVTYFILAITGLIFLAAL